MPWELGVYKPVPHEWRIEEVEREVHATPPGFLLLQESPMLIAISTTKNENGLFSKQ
jgi:hypothetical protein